MSGGVTLGVLGGTWRGTVSDRGGLTWGVDESLDWWVAADDRWHDPRVETNVRQQRLGGAPVVETKVRVPQGDVVQRVFAVADAGGLTIVEFENASPMPVAIALDRRDLLASRPPSEAGPQGIDLPPGSAVHPLAHTATIRFAIPHDGRPAGSLPPVPSVTQVVRGWTSQLERASRLVLPEAALVDDVLAARASVALDGLDDPDDDPAGFLLGVHEMVRLGADARDWIGEIAGAAEAVARRSSRSGHGWDHDRALVAAGAVFHATGEERAVEDIGAMRARLGERASQALADPGGVRTIAWAEDRLVRPGTDGMATLLPTGVPSAWLGANFECHRIPAGPCHTVSFAVRWHGERPALLWETTGPAGLRLEQGGSGGSWHTTEPSGEALLPPP